jgi:hypothetical protein
LENLKHSSQLANEMQSILNNSKIDLGILDLGCGGGPDNIFRELDGSGIHINYHGYDFNDDEINRLCESYPSNFQFFSKKIVTNQMVEMEEKWWSNFSAGQASINANISEFSKNQILENNFWNSELVSKSNVEITVKEILESSQTDFNLLKIDLDGPDFGYLQDFFKNTNYIPQFVSLEINYQGSGSSNANTFHNTDRFMKDKGYELMAITSRTYSHKSLPSRFEYNIFAQTIKGIPYQGDAFYFKKNEYLNIGEIFRDIILLDAFNLEDQAASIVLDNWSLIGVENSETILNSLTREVWGSEFKKYKDLIDMWDKDKFFFYPQEKKLQSDILSNVLDLRIKVLLKILVKKLVKKIFF